MSAKVYTTEDNELVEFIKSKGWIEIFNDKRLERKIGKRIFRKSMRSKGEIYFDYINVKFSYGHKIFSSKIKVTNSELNAFINYCTNSSLRIKLQNNGLEEKINNFDRLISTIQSNIESYSLYPSQKNKIKNWGKIIQELQYN